MNHETEQDLSTYMRGQQLATKAINQEGGEEGYPSNPALMAKQLEGKTTLSNLMMNELSKAARAGNTEGRQEGFGVGQTTGIEEGHAMGTAQGRQDGFRVGQMAGREEMAESPREEMREGKMGEMREMMGKGSREEMGEGKMDGPREEMRERMGEGKMGGLARLRSN